MTTNIYGPSGSGKTSLACTFPTPILIIGAEDGTDSVSDQDDVDIADITSSLQIAGVVEEARSRRKYQTVILDTATSLQSLILAEILGMKELPTQLSWGLATQDQWGQSALATTGYMRAILRLAEEGIANAIILGQERAFGQGSGTDDILAPRIMTALTGSAVGWLNPACDFIIHTFTRSEMTPYEVTTGEGKNKRTVTKTKPSGKIEYCARVGPDPVYMTKFRKPKHVELPSVVVDPDYDKFRAIIEGRFSE